MSNENLFHSKALSDRVAVVTGAAGGLGASICQQLAAMGAHVVQVDWSYLEPSREIGSGFEFRCDISKPESIEALGNFVKQHFGRCDVLVNNAAVSAPLVALESFPIEQWDRIFSINLRGALLCAQAVVPMMFAQQAGSIVNIASITAQAPGRIGAYGPAKAGLIGLTRQMAVEWGPKGVRANSISPGMIRTPLSEDHYRDPAKLQARQSQIPARRIGRPEDIGDAVAFLASDASTYVNGQDIVVDGAFLTAALSNLYKVDANL